MKNSGGHREIRVNTRIRITNQKSVAGDFLVAVVTRSYYINIVYLIKNDYFWYNSLITLTICGQRAPEICGGR